MKFDLSQISQEASFPADPVQRALIGFSKSGGFIIWFYGEILEHEIDALGASADELGITDNNSPDEGIWVWEGIFHYSRDWEGEYDVDVSTNCWREPTDEEWSLIRSNINPFEPYCPKCKHRVEGEQCTNCGFFLPQSNSNSACG